MLPNCAHHSRHEGGRGTERDSVCTALERLCRGEQNEANKYSTRSRAKSSVQTQSLLEGLAGEKKIAGVALDASGMARISEPPGRNPFDRDLFPKKANAPGGRKTEAASQSRAKRGNEKQLRDRQTRKRRARGKDRAACQACRASGYQTRPH